MHEGPVGIGMRSQQKGVGLEAIRRERPSNKEKKETPQDPSTKLDPRHQNSGKSLKKRMRVKGKWHGRQSSSQNWGGGDRGVMPRDPGPFKMAGWGRRGKKRIKDAGRPKRRRKRKNDHGTRPRTVPALEKENQKGRGDTVG